MQRTLLLFCLISFSTFLAISQEDQNSSTSPSYHKNIYASGFGANAFVGINLDMRISKGKMDGLGIRLGLGGLSSKSFSERGNTILGVLSFPIELNYLIGKKHHYFISGIGLIPMNVSVTYENHSTQREYDYDEYFSKTGFIVHSGFIVLGYRYQPINNGLMFQLNWSPYFNKTTGFNPLWFEIGLGMGFK